MKVLLALSIILGGVLVTKNSFAGVFGSDTLQMSGPQNPARPIINPAVHAENKPQCPKLAAEAAKKGEIATNTGSGSTIRGQ